MSSAGEIESHGGALSNILHHHDGSLLRRIFRDAGVSPPPADWYPLSKVLQVFTALGEALGADALFRIGQTVPQHAVFPAQVDSAETALRTVDIAFHLNHRKGGQPMFDPATGSMLEGIGHYRYEHGGGRVAVCAVTSVYPCPFDRGILTGITRRFVDAPVVVHLGGCRAEGAPGCRYAVAWRSRQRREVGNP